MPPDDRPPRETAASGAPAADPAAARPAVGARDAGDEPVLPLFAEEAVVGRRRVERGRVRVKTVARSFDEVVRAALASEEVEIERVAVGREVAEAPGVREEPDGTLVVPVVEEVAVVETRLVLREEVRLRRRRRTEEAEIPVTLRRQEAVVERLPGGGAEQPETRTQTEEDGR
jgi:uncharacterized protein (TIGR02271 family)